MKGRNELFMYELNDMYDDFLNDCYGLVTVAGMQFGTARLLKQADPIAYDIGFTDWLDQQIEEGFIIESGNKYFRYTEEN